MLGNKKSSGFTLIELLLVVGFISLATLGIYAIFNKTQAISIANEDTRVLEALRKGIEVAYESSANYTGLDNVSLNAANITPLEMRNGTTNEIVGKTGGQLTISAINNGGFTDIGFRITYPNIKTTSCAKMILGLIEQFDIISINGTTVKTFGGTTTLDSVTTACASAGDFATVVFSVISSEKQSAISVVPPTAPSTVSSFRNITTPLICDFEDAGFNYGATAIPNNIRNQVIMTYRTVDNHVGRCPNSTEYNPWIDRISSEKTSNPGMTYQDIFSNIVEPLMINSGTISYTKASRISAANSECQTAASPTYGALATTARYQLYSGNKCNI